MHAKRVVVWLRLLVVGRGAARLVLLLLKAPAAPAPGEAPSVAWGWRWTAGQGAPRRGAALAGRGQCRGQWLGPARVQFKRRPATRPRWGAPAGPYRRGSGSGFDPDLPSGRAAVGLPGPTTCGPARDELQFPAVVSCGPPLNTPPISSGTVPKEEPSHNLGDNSQGLPSGLHIPTLGGIDPAGAVLSTSAYSEPLLTSATDQQTSQWLQKHRFGAHLRTFNSFCGADLLRLTRDDLIQICGLADGIRLFNALHSKSLTPALTIYLTHASVVGDSKGSVFRALYLNSLNCGELSMRLAAHVGLSTNQIAEIFLEGPGGIRVLITNEVVQHMKNEGLFTVELCQEHNTDRFCLLLKPTTK